MVAIELMILGLETLVKEKFDHLEPRFNEEQMQSVIQFLRSLQKKFLKILASKNTTQLEHVRFFVKAIGVLNLIHRDLGSYNRAKELDDKMMYFSWAKIRIYDLRREMNC